MTLQEKIRNIRERLLLNHEQMSTLLNIDKKELISLENNKMDFTKELIQKFTSIFDLEESEFSNENLSLPNLSLKKEIDIKKYPNLFKAYSELLKFYFPKPCRIYVLTKIKQKNKLNSFLDLFFNNNKSSVINEMKSFTPSYLIEKDDKYLLVNIDTSNLYIMEINLKQNENTFIKNGYKYKKANEINLK